MLAFVFCSGLYHFSCDHSFLHQTVKKGILEKLTYYHTKLMKQKLDNTNSSAKDKLKIVSNK